MPQVGNGGWGIGNGVSLNTQLSTLNSLPLVIEERGKLALGLGRHGCGRGELHGLQVLREPLRLGGFALGGLAARLGRGAGLALRFQFRAEGEGVGGGKPVTDERGGRRLRRGGAGVSVSTAGGGFS